MTSAQGPRTTPVWLHVAISAAVGGLIVTVAQAGVMSLAFGGEAYAAFQAVVAFVAFAAVGQVFSGRPHGWRQGLTVLVWVPVVVWAFLGNDGEHGLAWVQPLTYAAGATVASIAALLMHEGWLRIVGAVVGVGLATGTLVMVNHRDHVDDRRAAIAEFGTSVRPWVIGLDGYRQHGDPTVVSPEIVRTSFYRPEQVNQPGLALTITTDSSTTEVCGDLLRADLAGGYEQPEKTCQQSGGIWRRTSKDGHEVALVEDGRVVRVAASNGLPERELTDALESVRPMSDRYYRHALFGEEGEYIPELDGAR